MKQRLKECLEEISTFLANDIKDLDDLCHFEDKNLLEQLDVAISEISVSNYRKYQCNNPFKSSVYYDHGLISSLIFLRLMNEEFQRHENNPVTRVESTSIIWHKSFLVGSILQTAIAIALHNLNQYEQALTRTAREVTIFDFNGRALSWLLKVSDILQEWDKPEAQEGIMVKEIEPTTISISLRNNKIAVAGFPSRELGKVQDVLTKFTKPADLIEFV
jgi:hypothetical protein